MKISRCSILHQNFINEYGQERFSDSSHYPKLLQKPNFRHDKDLMLLECNFNALLRYTRAQKVMIARRDTAKLCEPCIIRLRKCEECGNTFTAKSYAMKGGAEKTYKYQRTSNKHNLKTNQNTSKNVLKTAKERNEKLPSKRCSIIKSHNSKVPRKKCSFVLSSHSLEAPEVDACTLVNNKLSELKKQHSECFINNFTSDLECEKVCSTSNVPVISDNSTAPIMKSNLTLSNHRVTKSDTEIGSIILKIPNENSVNDTEDEDDSIKAINFCTARNSNIHNRLFFDSVFSDTSLQGSSSLTEDSKLVVDDSCAVSCDLMPKTSGEWTAALSELDENEKDNKKSTEGEQNEKDEQNDKGILNKLKCLNCFKKQKEDPKVPANTEESSAAVQMEKEPPICDDKYAYQKKVPETENNDEIIDDKIKKKPSIIDKLGEICGKKAKKTAETV